MGQLNSLSILLTLILLLLVPSLAAAEIVAESMEISYQVNNSDRIIIGTVSKIGTFYDYTIYTIAVKEWLYNPIPVETIKVRSEIGTSKGIEDEVEFAQNESALLMLMDENLDKQLFRVPLGVKYPISDRDTVIEELKAQGMWQEENQTVNEIKDAGIAENAVTVGEQDESQNKTNYTGMTENTGTAGDQEENSNSTQRSNSIPFIGLFQVFVTFMVAVMYARK
ncbi:hypothetical protein MSHOH_0631 [Methanosarcina horonobensis HB-1 = JCM 15518]|uniref:Uncharacterized protein n=1 Tax=Methanosarcina horonobensis HB-1 = JCM 15518 TaxID=1434110 RepID=A0A0E3S718_9EURY|nr:hypothetical protein [Methanosarcina horonobensis]AKB77114.1 hypothetical protein MSHOH_0631 [Methanosarcina horonobensis HB-1 = JCM 15518]